MPRRAIHAVRQFTSKDNSRAARRNSLGAAVFAAAPASSPSSSAAAVAVTVTEKNKRDYYDEPYIIIVKDIA